MTTRTLVGPVTISGGTPLASGRITFRPIPELPYDAAYVSPALVTYYIIDGAIHGDADGQDDATITSPTNGEFSVYIGRNRVHRFTGSVAESAEDVKFSDIYATSRSVVNTDPWLVREGDDITRLGSDDADAGQVPTADGAGGVTWEDPSGGGGGGGAPTGATYIVQTPHASLSAEQPLSALATGLLKNTTSTGVLTIATAADLPTHQHAGEDITSGTVAAARIASLDAAKITTGQFPIARLASGTPDGTKYVRDDGTLATPPGGGSGAPTDATYIVQTPNGSLSAEQALSALSTGLLKVTTATGVLSTAAASDLPAGIDAAKIGDGSVTNAEFQRLDATSSIQTQLDAKAATSHNHAASDITSGTLAEARLPTGIDAAKLADGSVSNTELQYIGTVTSNVQTQLNGKLAKPATPGADAALVTMNIDGTTSTTGNLLDPTYNIFVDLMAGANDWEKIEAAWDAAIDAGGANVYFSAREYNTTARAFQTSGGNNCKLVIPSRLPITESEIVIRCRGVKKAAPSYSLIPEPNGTSFPDVTGSRIVDTSTGSGTNPSLIGGAGPTSGTGSFDGFTKIRMEFEDMIIRTANNHATGNPTTPAPATMIALDLSNCWGASVDTCLIDTGLNNELYWDDDLEPAAGTVGVWMPKGSNAGQHILRNCHIQGYEAGIRHSEHLELSGTFITYCKHAIECGDDGVTLTTGHASHGSHYTRVLICNSVSAIVPLGPAMITGGQVNLEIYGGSDGTQWFSPEYAIDDPDHHLWGEALFTWNVGDGKFKVNGAKHFRVKPAFPSVLFHKDSTVVSGGSISNVTGNPFVAGGEYSYQASLANGDGFSIRWPGGVALWLQPGAMYKVLVMGIASSDAAILTLTTSETAGNIGVLDFYAATTTYNVVKESQPFMIKEGVNDSFLTINGTVTGRNAGNTGSYYALHLTKFVLMRCDNG